VALFLYGTLMDVDVMAKVLDRAFAGRELTPAALPGWRRIAVRNASYPVILPDPSGRVEGRLFARPSARDLARIRHFESEEYLPARVRVELADGHAVPAEAFVALDGVFDLDEVDWDLDGWRARHKSLFLRRCEEWMRDFPALLPA
jgi:gamma-glutamylcyclotransferase (GGCT)/AIG2-like uncharacterized protein YtfP